MATMRLEATYPDGSKKIANVKPGDLVRFERHFGLNWEEVQKNARIEHLIFLTWSALHRTGEEPREFEAFLDDVEDLDDPDAVEADNSADDESKPAPEPFQPVTEAGAGPLVPPPPSSPPSP